MKNIAIIAEAVKSDSYMLAAISEETRNRALTDIVRALSDGRAAILAANEADLTEAEKTGLAAPLLKRLKFDNDKLDGVIQGIRELAALPDPLFQTRFARQLDEGLILKQVTCPIGVIGVIFESRPDALVQISTLCLKSGNCAILKGGSEAKHTNAALFDLIHQAGVSAGIPAGFLTLLESREEIGALLSCEDSIDLLIPRGSNAFVRYIMDNTKIPVMGHADGICHVYVDKYADLEKSIPIVMDAKTQYVAVCNAAETLLVHRAVADAFLPLLSKAAEKAHVQLIGCPETQARIACIPARETDYRTEYLDYILTVRVVDGLDAAIGHINRYGSHHTDAILTEDPDRAERFMQLVDSADVFHNCSTRFSDGYRYGFGAEVGVSTSKLHARGPVGLEGLITYKYKLYGNGHVVADYASGQKAFRFADIS